MAASWAQRAILTGLERLGGGTLRLDCPDGTYRFGRTTDLDASLVVHNDRFFARALTGADIGLGEAYMDGDWSTPDLVNLVRLFHRNRHLLDGHNTLTRAMTTFAGAWARRRRDNTVTGSREHIHRHYDLGNDFFRLFLDADLRMYSSAYFDAETDSLEAAQASKVDRICRMLRLGPSDHVLEIGTGWGGFARWAAERYGCHVTTTTISEEQFRHVREWNAAHPDVGRRIDVRLEDYRELSGRFDKIVSIEMFEAVGLNHYDDYFKAVDRLLVPDGAMVLQTITVDDQWFPHYHGAPDWIEKYIFPGGELASIGHVLESLTRVTSLSMYAAENFGTHYARTLHAWRERFHANLDRVRGLGFDERFIRMWDFYLGLCEATFLERHTGVFQLMLAKNGTRRRLFNEPWVETPAGAEPARALAASAA